ncbi:MAG: PHP domain-containing protein [Lachnospiraceae bacterium]|nr:PHP domain-containing protein [Lachnospiraceae bacterium]
MKYPTLIDMHMHTDASDGTDTAAQIINAVKNEGIGIFAVTDHDTAKNCTVIRGLLSKDDPYFINGVEFSCKDDFGKYHILGYAYKAEDSPVCELTAFTHSQRVRKVRMRLQMLEENYEMTFPEDELEALFRLNNPGKPHIANLMIKHGYAANREEAIRDVLNKLRVKGVASINPQRAIYAIKKSGGIPVLAHAVFGDGSQLLDEAELHRRIQELKGMGLMGLECYYSGFSPKQQQLMLSLADQYQLLISAGSDYHGKNKMIFLGDTNLADANKAPESLHAFLDQCLSLSGY